MFIRAITPTSGARVRRLRFVITALRKAISEGNLVHTPEGDQSPSLSRSRIALSTPRTAGTIRLVGSIRQPGRAPVHFVGLMSILGLELVAIAWSVVPPSPASDSAAGQGQNAQILVLRPPDACPPALASSLRSARMRGVRLRGST